MKPAEITENARLKTRVAVVMQCRALENRWQSEVWEPLGVLANYEGAAEARVLVEQAGLTQWLYPGFEIALRLSEAEGYYHNVSSEEPCVFILWRMQGADAGPQGADAGPEKARAVPQYVTVSYDEASRWMDGGESVDRVPMPPELFAWVGEFVEKNYRFTPKKRIRPQSFLSPKDRGRSR
jgi:Protein of unknown function (DUF3305)